MNIRFCDILLPDSRCLVHLDCLRVERIFIFCLLILDLILGLS